MKLKKLLAPLVLVLILAACKTSDKLALQLNYQKGKKYYYTTTTNQKMKQSIGGKSIDMDNTTTMGYIYEVKDINKDGDFLVTITYDKYEIKYGGSTPPPDTKMNMQDMFKGFTFDMVVTPKGKVKEVHGMEKLFDKAMDAAFPDSLKDSPGMDVANPMIENIKKQFSDKNMGSMMEQMTNYFPDGEVSEGDSWERVVNNNTIIPMKITSTYKVKEIKDNVIVLDVESKYSPGDGDGGAMAAMGMKMDLKGGQKGTMEIDTKSGLVVKSNLDMDMETTVSFMGVTSPGMNMTGTTTMEAKEMN